ncbi:MAG TPA: hypothetical protein VNU46_01125 [Gemmatimonadaceae bacterium]|jgi:hypothetical protein|nr:hypothetical protein [Gemmatimonadaceae bacterium]
MTMHSGHLIFPSSPRCRVFGRFRVAGGALGILCLGALLGCNDLTGSQALPAGTQAPAYFNTPTGAIGMWAAALYQVEQMLPTYIVDTGLLTDELESNQVGASPGLLINITVAVGGSLDERILPELSAGGGTSADNDYAALQAVRGGSAQALGALATYDTAVADTATVKVRRGELYALTGYVEILMADFFCSGVPLSTFDYQKNYTYHPSSTTDQVYQDAIAKEDSALALADTSMQVLNLARVLKGRALLDLDSIATAAQVVAAVPDSFQFQLAIQWLNNGISTSINILNNVATVSDREGGNGLPFVSGGDPRTAVTSQGTSPTGAVLYFPNRYSPSGFSPFPVATGIEARLIQAEAALRTGDPTTWLTRLNHLRETAMVPGQMAALSDTTDPGTDTARVSLTFQERAYWLFVSGHRVGDLRRLLRQYGRPQYQVFPTGLYLAPGTGTYGTAVNAPISSLEYLNPDFHGCLDRNP